MTKNNDTPKIMFTGERQLKIWQLAAKNNKKGRIVTKRINPNCERVGLL